MSEEQLIDQPKPKFNLIDLEQKLSETYNIVSGAIKNITELGRLEAIKQANSNLQELIAIVDKCKRDLDSIDMPSLHNPLVQTILQTNKPAFYVCGVQFIENKILKGTSLYTTIFKAKTIRDKLNEEFAKLRVNHEAKIINYPVF